MVGGRGSAFGGVQNASVFFIEITKALLMTSTNGGRQSALRLTHIGWSGLQSAFGGVQNARVFFFEIDRQSIIGELHEVGYRQNHMQLLPIKSNRLQFSEWITDLDIDPDLKGHVGTNPAAIFKMWSVDQHLGQTNKCLL